jgi:hypothetical protein
MRDDLEPLVVGQVQYSSTAPFELSNDGAVSIQYLVAPDEFVVAVVVDVLWFKG